MGTWICASSARRDVVTEYFSPVRLRHDRRGAEVARPVEPRPKGRVARNTGRHLVRMSMPCSIASGSTTPRAKASEPYRLRP